MTDLLTVLPDFCLDPFSHLVPPLERAILSLSDLLSLPPAAIAKRAAVSIEDVVRLTDAVSSELHAQSAVNNARNYLKQTGSISTLDDVLDSALSGGIETANIVEFVGESAVGKTQFLLTLLLSVQLAAPLGLSKAALYISTEAPLSTTRLAQILNEHPRILGLPPNERPSLRRVHSIHVHDLEAQEHILRFQVPVAVERHDIGLIVIDSIAANYRPEFGKGTPGARSRRPGPESFARRSRQLAQIGHLLRGLASKHGLTVVVANQVADRFAPADESSGPINTTSSRPSTPAQLPTSPSASSNGLTTDDPLALDHQQRFFTGWGDDALVTTNLKTPSLGLTWANQLSARIVLTKAPIYADEALTMGEERDIAGWIRTFKVVTSAWCAPCQVTFEITPHGVAAVSYDNST